MSISMALRFQPWPVWRKATAQPEAESSADPNHGATMPAGRHIYFQPFPCGKMFGVRPRRPIERLSVSTKELLQAAEQLSGQELDELVSNLLHLRAQRVSPCLPE